MPRVIISDTSTLIIFQKIDEMNLLFSIYGELLTTSEVAYEFGDVLPDWIKIEAAKDKKYQDFLSTQVDLGEASAIALATEFEDALLLLDDLKARKLAKRMGFKISGALGVIHKAKELLIIERVKPIINKLILTDFRISENIIKDFLKLNNE